MLAVAFADDTAGVGVIRAIAFPFGVKAGKSLSDERFTFCCLATFEPVIDPSCDVFAERRLFVLAGVATVTNSLKQIGEFGVRRGSRDFSCDENRCDTLNGDVVGLSVNELLSNERESFGDFCERILYELRLLLPPPLRLVGVPSE